PRPRGSQLRDELLHRRQNLLVVDGLVVQPVGLRVFGLQTLVELERLYRPASKRHRVTSWAPPDRSLESYPAPMTCCVVKSSYGGRDDADPGGDDRRAAPGWERKRARARGPGGDGAGRRVSERLG